MKLAYTLYPRARATDDSDTTTPDQLILSWVREAQLEGVNNNFAFLRLAF